MRVTLDEVCTKATSKYAQKDLANMTGNMLKKIWRI